MLACLSFSFHCVRIQCIHIMQVLKACPHQLKGEGEELVVIVSPPTTVHLDGLYILCSVYCFVQNVILHMC